MNEEISYLFVPANKEVMFSKALTYGADAIILNPEDTVHPDEKSHGCDNVLNWLYKLNKSIVKIGIYIRINPPRESLKTMSVY